MGVRIQWTDNNVTENGHKIYRSTTPMNPESMPAPIAELASDVTHYDDGDVSPGNIYYYRVSAVSGENEALSDEIAVPVGETIPADFVARYLFDGNFEDVTGNFNGANSGCTFVGAGNGPGGTDLGIAAGAGAFLELGTALATAIGTSSGTVSLAYRPKSTGQSQVFTAAKSTANDSYHCLQVQNVTPWVNSRQAGAETYIVESDTDVPFDVWSHIIIRIDGSSTHFRINGVNATKTAVQGSDLGKLFADISGIDRLTIGALRRSSQINGPLFHIAFLTLYPRYLSDSECQALENEYI